MNVIYIKASSVNSKLRSSKYSSIEFPSGEERYQEKSLRTRESETNQSITEISNEVKGATNVDINESRALGTTFR